MSTFELPAADCPYCRIDRSAVVQLVRGHGPVPRADLEILDGLHHCPACSEEMYVFVTGAAA